MQGIIEIMIKENKMSTQVYSCEISLEQGTPPVSYWHRPGKKKILLVHGWLSSGRGWLHLFRDIPDEYSIIAPDLPGHGRTLPLPVHRINLREYSRILGLFLDKTPGGAVDIVAADSMGALLVLMLMQEGRKVAPGMLFSGCPFLGLPWYLFFTRAKTLNIILLKIPGILPPALGRGILHLTNPATNRCSDLVNRRVNQDAMAADPTTAGILLKELHGPVIGGNTINTDDCRVLVLRGKLDMVASRHSGKALANNLNCPYQELPGIGHIPMMEKPGEYVKILMDLAKAE